MSGLVMGTVLKYSRSRGNARLVLLVIGDCCKDDGSDAWPSVSLIAERAGISERTVQRCLQELTELGELQIRYKAGPREANLYDVIMGGDRLSPRKVGGDKEGGGVVTKTVGGGDRAVSPDPSLIRPNPSLSLFKRETREEDRERGFNAFYGLYPRKANKPGAISAWKKIAVDDYPKIMLRLETFIKVDWAVPYPFDKIPHPATWLNQQRWNDPIVKPSSPPKSTSNGRTAEPDYPGWDAEEFERKHVINSPLYQGKR